MKKKVYIGENGLIKIKNAMAGKNVSHSTFVHEDKPPYEKDEFEIGGEGGNNDFFHINSKKQLTESARADLDAIDSISFTVDEKYNFDEDEYSHWWDYYNTEDEYLKSCEYYDGEVYDTDGHLIEYFGGNRDEVEYYFADNLNIAEKIFNRDAVLRGNTYWITDIQDELVNEMNVDINNVDEVNKAAKKLSKPNGVSLFVLVDGSTIGFHDHAQIQSVCDGMTISKFLELGNIRCGGGNVVTIQLIKEPTFYQRHTLKNMLEYADEAIVDFAEPNKYDNMYPEVVHSVSYKSPNPERVVNDMVYYFRDGIKPFDESIERKSKKLNENTFEKWFSNSVLTDSDGKPIKMYHGTSENFDTFSKDFIGSSGSGCYEGYGFNFTPAWSRAVSYSSGGNVIEAYLRAINPLRSDEHKITVKQLVEIIRKIDEGLPITDTLVPNYESPRYGENWDENYYNRAVKVMAKNLIEFNYEYGDAGVYAGVCESGSADPKKVISVFEEMGYDSVIFFEDKGIKTVIVFEPNQIKRVDNKTFNIDSDVMSENIEAEVEASEVKLDSFKKNDTLAPRMWDGFDLNPRARLKLLDIADDFWDFANITWVKRKGIHLTGSICNFNWSKFSDIDLHIVVDFSKIDERKDFVQEYFNSKKNEWNNEHSNLKIFGYPVELYVEDINAETASGGLYDLEKNDWIKKPIQNNIKQIGLDKYEIKNKSAKLMTSIDDLYDELNSTDDDAELREIGAKAHKLLNKIKRMRKFGLNRGGESDSFNIIYKVLRRAGYMDMLWDLSSELYDKLNSIEIDDEKILEIAEKYIKSNLNEEVVADGKYKSIIRHIIEEINRKKLVIEENGGQICDFSFIC